MLKYENIFILSLFIQRKEDFLTVYTYRNCPSPFKKFLFVILILMLFFFSLVAGPALVATGRLGEHSDVLDPSGTHTLTTLGNHILAQELADHRRLTRANLEANLPPPPDPSFLSRVPAHFCRLLGRAYGELNLVHDEALTLSLLNQTSPHSYPDPEKRDRALLLVATEELLEQEIDRVSSLNAFKCGRTLQLI